MTSIIRRFQPTIFNPSVFDDLFKDIDDVFGSCKTPVPYNVEQITDKDGNVTSSRIEVALAGYDKNDIKIKIVGDELQILVNKTEKAGDKQYIHKGISERSTQLKFKLSGIYDKQKVKSLYKNGLLTVEVPVLKEEVISVNID